VAPKRYGTERSSRPGSTGERALAPKSAISPKDLRGFGGQDGTGHGMRRGREGKRKEEGEGKGEEGLQPQTSIPGAATAFWPAQRSAIIEFVLTGNLQINN